MSSPTEIFPGLMITVFIPTIGHVLYFSFVKLIESFPFGCRKVFNVVSGSPSLSRCKVSKLIVVTTLKLLVTRSPKSGDTYQRGV